MHKAYYESSGADVLEWHHGKRTNEGCWSQNCSGFAMYSFKDEDDDDSLEYLKHEPRDNVSE